MKFKYFFACLLLTGFAYGSDATLSKGTLRYIAEICATGKMSPNNGSYGHALFHPVINILYGSGKNRDEICNILLACRPDGKMTIPQWKSNLDQYLQKYVLVDKVQSVGNAQVIDEVKLVCKVSSKVNPEDEMKALVWAVKDSATVQHGKSAIPTQKRPAVRSPINLPSPIDWESFD